MKHLLALILWLCANILTAQTRGLSMSAATAARPEGKTYALIVGISKYKNAAIPQLQYADKDAEAFRSYLLASGVDSGNIILLTNENARYADIMLDLDDLCSTKVKAGDKVFIYFSGHGDVESHVITNDGYLLPYDAPKIVYAISAINVKILQTYVATLSSKGVLAIVITDACHSGNLAGGVEGLKNIQTVLKENWKDEVKILSCQPGELSLEGKQWGGGRGLFSYELINGMAGMADKNNDGIVSLRELNLYLMDKIPDGASPLPQNPMLSGNMATNISQVNKGLLASLSSHSGANILASIDVKGMDESLLKGLDDSIKKNYRAFQLCMDSEDFTGAWLNKPPRASSPYDFYVRIPDNDSTKLLKALMKRNYASAILRDLDAILETQVHNRFRGTTKDDRKRLRIEGTQLRQMLGDEKLKNLGFFSKAIYWNAYRTLFNDNPPEFALDPTAAILMLDTCIASGGDDAFIFVLRGELLLDQKKYPEAFSDLHRSLIVSPNCAPSYRMMGYAYAEIHNYDSSIIAYQGLNRVADWNWLGNNGIAEGYYHLNKLDSMNYYLEKWSKDHPKADSDWVASNYSAVARLFAELHLYNKAIEYNDKTAAVNAGYRPDAYYNNACYYSLSHDRPNAIKYLEKAIKSGWTEFDSAMKDTDLDNVKQDAEFKALMRKYFPDKYKD